MRSQPFLQRCSRLHYSSQCQHNPLVDRSRNSTLVNFFGVVARMAVEGVVGLGMAGQGVTLILRASWFNRSSWICAKEITAIRLYGCRAFTSPWISDFRPSMKKPFLELLPRESSMGVFKSIEPLSSISLEVYGSDLHPCGIGGSIEPKIALRTRDISDRVSFFPSWEVNLHVRIVRIRGDVSKLLRIVSPI
ncbi:hypothetical protein BHE74_00056110 [Ensete ventricosum]|nr:hypothetical protein BHE74_00056110 [Ensete ventricosum]